MLVKKIFDEVRLRISILPNISTKTLYYAVASRLDIVTDVTEVNLV